MQCFAWNTNFQGEKNFKFGKKNIKNTFTVHSF